MDGYDLVSRLDILHFSGFSEGKLHLCVVIEVFTRLDGYYTSLGVHVLDDGLVTRAADDGAFRSVFSC